MSIYSENIENIEKILKNLNKKSIQISFFRVFSVLIFLIAIYFYPQNFSFFWMIFSLLSFLYLVIQHQKIKKKEKFNKILLHINVAELNYEAVVKPIATSSFLRSLVVQSSHIPYMLRASPFTIKENIFSRTYLFLRCSRGLRRLYKRVLQRPHYLEKNDLKPFKNGENFKEKSHLYTEDLDIFGTDSLFQHLNRTATFLGEKNLAERLKKINLEEENILKHQVSIKELSKKIDFRQKIYAHAKWLTEDLKNEEKLEIWLHEKIVNLPTIILKVIKIFPIFLFVFFTIWFFTDQAIFLQFSFFLI